MKAVSRLGRLAGTWRYGPVAGALPDLGGDLVWSRRNSTADPFPPPSALVMATVAAGSADLTSDCRSLYYVFYDETPQTRQTVQVMVMQQ